MSLILDALNRSRQDSEQMPGLSSVHGVEAVPQGSHWLQWLLVSALGLAVLAIGWLLLDRAPQPGDAPAEIAVTVAQPSVAPEADPTSATEPKTGVAPQAKIPAVPASPPPVEAAQSPAVANPPVSEEIAPTKTAVAVEPGIDPGVAALYQQRSQPAPAQQVPSVRQSGAESPTNISRVEETLDIEQLVAQAEAELRDARLDEHEVPLLATLSQQTKDDIPTLLYERHDYSGDPARSSVVINGKTLGAGASGGGVKVVEILPDSVVLEVKGIRFRLRALNSWVNL